MHGIGNHIDQWEENKIKSFNNCFDTITNCILFIPRLILWNKRNLD